MDPIVATRRDFPSHRGGRIGTEVVLAARLHDFLPRHPRDALTRRATRRRTACGAGCSDWPSCAAGTHGVGAALGFALPHASHPTQQRHPPRDGGALEPQGLAKTPTRHRPLAVDALQEMGVEVPGSHHRFGSASRLGLLALACRSRQRNWRPLHALAGQPIFHSGAGQREEHVSRATAHLPPLECRSHHRCHSSFTWLCGNRQKPCRRRISRLRPPDSSFGSKTHTAW